MIAYLLDESYRDSTAVSADPRCGEDFCDSCGDCLRCYGDDWCPSGHHVWYVYADDAARWREEHPEAMPA